MKHKSLVAVLLMVIFMASVTYGQKDHKSSVVDNTVDPRIYMPLAVGNSWTYKWQKGTSPEIYVRMFYLTETTTQDIFSAIRFDADRAYHHTYSIVSTEKSRRIRLVKKH